MNVTTVRVNAVQDIAAVLAAIVVGWLTTRYLLYPALDLPANVPMILRPIAGFACALLLLRWRSQTLRDVGLVPTAWWRALGLAGLLIAALAGFERLCAPALVEWLGAPAPGGYLAVMRGNTAAFLFWLAVSWLVGGFIEECLFRGFLLRRIELALGGDAAAGLLAAIAQAALFGVLHLYAGPFMGALTASFALIFGLAYLVTGRQLWPLVLAHGMWNTASLWNIYRS